MIKKVLIAGLFIGGGLYFIKRILPQTSANLSSKEVDVLSVDEVVEKQKAKQDRYNMELQNKITQTGLYNLIQYGGKPTR